jgi:RNA polymerase sigma-70 factor (ECF subfamily)
LTEPNKFIELFKPCYNDALRYTRSLCSGKDKDIAGDVLQQSLLQAIEGLPTLKDESKFRSWLFSIITNVFYTNSRKYFWKRKLSLSDDETNIDIPEVFDRYKQTEERMLLGEALSRLNTKDRAAILLFEIGNFSIQEIADIQKEKTVSAVKSRLSRTRQKLKTVILQLENSDYLNSKNPQTKNFNLENETSELISRINSDK